jgi:DNA modification methylase
VIKVKIFQGHVLDALRQIPDNSVDCIVTSPPYWGLRKYPDATNVHWNDGWYGQLGLEPTLEMYIEHLLQITAELKRVLKPTGIMFWNMGDCYANVQMRVKCMALQNFRLALRMIDEQGWILRNVIIWHKPNHLPESVKDRFTKAYEPIFMFVKSKHYYFNLDAVREPLKGSTVERIEQWIRNDEDSKDFSKLKPSAGNPNPQYVFQRLVHKFNYRVREAKKGYFEKLGVRASEEEMQKYDNRGKLIIKEKSDQYLGKNPGDVWTINTEPFPDAHFATFPTELVRRCIKAGCPENGIVLDPFVGSGTTIKVAIEERRNAIGIEIVPEYIQIAERRCNLVGNPFIEYEKIII